MPFKRDTRNAGFESSLVTPTVVPSATVRGRVPLSSTLCAINLKEEINVTLVFLVTRPFVNRFDRFSSYA